MTPPGALERQSGHSEEEVGMDGSIEGGGLARLSNACFTQRGRCLVSRPSPQE